MVKVANKEEMKELIDNWRKEYRVAAPVLKKRGKKERIEYEFVEEWEQIYLERQADISPKKYFLPQNEKLSAEIANQSEKPIILFAIRSCDIAGMKVLDDVFLHDDYIDAYYQEHHDKTTIVGFSCAGPEDTCFCHSLKVNPVENDRVPLYLFQDGDQYWFKVFDEDFAHLLASLPEGETGELEDIINTRSSNFSDNYFEFDLPVPLPEQDLFQAPVWEELTEKCLGCGICTYYCTTCYCFGFFWEGENKNRGWDSCMFSLYSKHASGHNPRQEKHQRFRQRIMHKYSYHPQNYGDLACTGCGRCIKNCPVNLDIRRGLTMIADYLDGSNDQNNSGYHDNCDSNNNDCQQNSDYENKGRE